MEHDVGVPSSDYEISPYLVGNGVDLWICLKPWFCLCKTLLLVRVSFSGGVGFFFSVCGGYGFMTRVGLEVRRCLVVSPLFSELFKECHIN